MRAEGDQPHVDIQFIPVRFEWGQLEDYALEAEELGYGAIWVVDHLAGRPMGSENLFECFAWLGALAATVKRISLGSLVTNVWNRNVGTAVVSAATVASISKKPFFFGIGAGTSATGSFAWEQDRTKAFVEPSLDKRHERVADVISLAKDIWSEPTETFLYPPVTPTVIVGVNTPRLARLAAARADGVNFWWHHPKREALLSALSERDSVKPFQMTAWLSWEPGLEDPEHPDRKQMSAMGLDRVVLSVRGRAPALER